MTRFLLGEKIKKKKEQQRSTHNASSAVFSDIFFLFDISTRLLSYLFFFSVLTALEEQHGNLTQVEVQEAMRVVCHEAAEVATDDAVPGGLVLLVELLLDVSGDILLDVELLHRLQGHLDRVRLHVLRHVGVLDGGLVVVVVHCRSGCSNRYGGKE